MSPDFESYGGLPVPCPVCSFRPSTAGTFFIANVLFDAVRRSCSEMRRIKLRMQPCNVALAFVSSHKILFSFCLDFLGGRGGQTLYRAVAFRPKQKNNDNPSSAAQCSLSLNTRTYNDRLKLLTFSISFLLPKEISRKVAPKREVGCCWRLIWTISKHTVCTYLI